MTGDVLFDSWVAALERTHIAELTFAELTRALRALSATYVVKRARIREGAAFDGAGKRAAFALFYGPLHYLLVARVADALALPRRELIVDVGCGTGAAGVAVGRIVRPREILGIDRSAWALAESSHTYRHFGLRARTRQGDAARMPWPPAPAVVIAAFALNEMDEGTRETARARLQERASRGDPVLIVEPLARGAAPWWGKWVDAFTEAGGRADEWRFRSDLPEIVARLDRAAGLDHRELTARSLYVARSVGRRAPRDPP